MNREILFRAKKIDDGEWVEGYLFDDGLPKPKRFFIGGFGIYEYEGAPNQWAINRQDIAEIDLDTICQYTGLKTASGVRIWENDIIAIATGENGEEYRGLVEYEHSGFVIKWVNSDYLRTDLWYWANRPGADVIGNAFDTPNLLSKELDSVVFHDFMKRGME